MRLFEEKFFTKEQLKHLKALGYDQYSFLQGYGFACKQNKEDLRKILNKPKVPFNIPLSYKMSKREAEAFRNGFARGFVRRNNILLSKLEDKERKQ